MTLVLLTGYHYMDFSPKDEPDKRIKGFNVYLCAPAGNAENGWAGVVPVSDGGKRFIGESACKYLGITREMLNDCLYDFIGVNFDINGKFTEFRPLTADEKRNNPDYPFDSNGSGNKEKSDGNGFF